jgi:hypothetical protein
MYIGMWGPVTFVRTDVSEESSASIMRMEKSSSKEQSKQ